MREKFDHSDMSTTPNSQSETTTTVHIVPCYVDLQKESNGVANIVRQIALRQAEAGFNTILICGNRELGNAKARTTAAHKPHLIYHVLNQSFHPILGPTKDLVRLLRQLPRPAVGHVHTCFSSFTEKAMIELRGRGIPFIFTPHGKLSPSSFNQKTFSKRLWWRLRGKRSIQLAEKIVCSSPEEAKHFLSFGFRNVSNIPNGYDENATSSANNTQTLFQKPYILFLGYLDPRKQPEFLVEAFSKSSAFSSHLLVIAGPDSYGHRRLVSNKIREYNAADRVILFGPAYGDTKWQLLKHADLLCLPSRGEGLPVTLCEGLGAGIPLLISAACNFSYAACNGAAIELGEFDAEAWAKAIDLIVSPVTRQSMADNAKMLAQKFTWASIVAKWQNLYDEVEHRNSRL
jgi:glycosyltransferase involved in cell wall biosynthesis